MDSEEIGPPTHWHSLLEGRVAAEAAVLMAQLPMLRLQLPKGSGPVMVLPGFMADDTSTWLLRRFLSSLGYSVAPWGMGVNRGRMLAYLGPLIERLDAIQTESQAQPSLVGWSRGGTLSREIARERPDLIRQVITLGSPVRGGVQGTSIGSMVMRQTGLTPAQINLMLQARQRREIVTPITAIYSKTDGVVSWQACVDAVNPNVTHRVVESSHMGLGFNSAVYRIVARTLAARHN
ncbi:MAG: alpha/beta hydrolase [Pseudomonadales bacterium]|nr:alpha/beta hydrolase [Pseudomonadales bacterium]